MCRELKLGIMGYLGIPDLMEEKFRGPGINPGLFGKFPIPVEGMKGNWELRILNYPKYSIGIKMYGECVETCVSESLPDFIKCN